MTVTLDKAAAELVPGVGTVKPAELVAALEAVIPHASTDRTLPVLCSVRFETDGGHLVIVASDRYTLGTFRLAWDGGPVDALLDVSAAKDLLRYAKAVPRVQAARPGLSLTFTADGLEVFDFERRQSWPLMQNVEFVKWRAVMDAHEPGDGVGAVGLTPVHLAKFGKACGKRDSLRFEFGRTPVKPVVVTVAGRADDGEGFRGLIMPVRLPGQPAV